MRKTHSIRGGNFFEQHIRKFAIPQPLSRYFYILMESHNYSYADLNNKVSRTVSTNEGIVDLLQLAAIFCSADLLEYSQNRVIDGVIDKLKEEVNSNPNDELLRSLYENTKHKNIEGNLQIFSDGKVIINGSFEEPEVLNLAYKAIDEIQEWLRIYVDIDKNSLKPRLRIRDAIQTDLEIWNKYFHRLGIQIKKENVIGLISSNSVWKQKPESVIKELLQNSIESCRYRAYISGKNHLYKPKIFIRFDSINRTIEVNDNGCGMDRNVILKNFLTVGNSRSKEPNYQSDNYHSLARFGIGFWSVFTIAETAVVDTAPFESNNVNQEGAGSSFEVNINSFKDYTVFDKKTLPIGTTILLKVKPEVNLLDLFAKIQGQFGIIFCSKIPIELFYDQNKTTIPTNNYLPNRTEIFGPKLQYVNDNNVQIFTKEIKKNSLTFKAFIVYRKPNDNLCFTLDGNISRATNLIHNYAVTTILGFHAPIQPIVPLHYFIGGEVFGYVLNQANPKGFLYDLNRQSLLENETKINISKELTGLIKEVYVDFLKKNNCYTPSEIYRLKQESSMHYGYSGRVSKTLLQNIVQCVPDLYCIKLIELNNYTPLHLSLTQFLELDYSFFSMYYFVNIHSGRVFHFDTEEEQLFLLPYIQNIPVNTLYLHNKQNIFFEHDPESRMVVSKFQTQYETAFITSVFTNSRKLNTNSSIPGLLAEVRGTWSGYILERKVENGMFTFLDSNTLIVDINSILSEKIKKLASEGNTLKLAGLCNLLTAAMGGFVDPQVTQYVTFPA